MADFFAFEESFTGGVYVAALDLDGDGKAEVVVTPDRGGGPVVAVYSGAKLAAGLSGDAAQVERFLGIDDPAFRGGVRVATGDFTGDDVPDIVTAAGPGAFPDVRVFDGATGALVHQFFAYGANFRGGVNVAIADLNGDGRSDIITGADSGAFPDLRAWDGATGQLLWQSFVYGLNFRGGVRVGP